MNDDFNINLLHVQKQFLRCCPVIDINFNVLYELLCEDYETKFIDATVNYPRVLQYPNKYSYQIAFLKKFINGIDEYFSDSSYSLCDYFYEHFTRVLNLNSFQQNVCYKHYLITENLDLITLEENPNFISGGTTGLCTWEGSLALAEWCLKYKNIFFEKNLFELGSGVGLLGVVISKFCSARRVCLSDCHEDVLKTLCKNLQLNSNVRYEQISDQNDQSDGINCSVLSGKTIFETFFDNGTRVHVKRFLWEDVNNLKDVRDFSFDYVVAADVVYDHSVFEHLCTAFKFFIDSNRQCVILLSCTVRNAQTLDSFLELVESNLLKITELEIVKPDTFYFTLNTPVKLFAIQSIDRILFINGATTTNQ